MFCGGGGRERLVTKDTYDTVMTQTKDTHDTDKRHSWHSCDTGLRKRDCFGPGTEGEFTRKDTA